ncbi:MAG: hypothetical protein EOO92_10085, partial [Pedobacter sp.]
MNQNHPPQKSKKTIAFIVIAIFIVVAAVALFYFRSKKEHNYNHKYVKYIESFTSGTISKRNTIKVHLTNPVNGMVDVGVPDKRNLFDFSPSIKGKSYWLDNQTIEFRPDEPLQSGETYDATFALSKVAQVEDNLEDFDFSFTVIKPGMAIANDGLVSQNNTSMDYMKLTGHIVTSDQEDPKAIEKSLTIDFPDKLKIKWQHDPERNIYNFSIDSIKKDKNLRELALQLSGDPIDADVAETDSKIPVPALGVFTVLNIKAVQDLEDYALVQFSEPVNVAQDLTGLITLNGLSDLRYTIDKSQVKIYTSQTVEGTYALTVNSGVENIANKQLGVTKNAAIVFENKSPSVTIPGTGTILPGSENLVLPFDAINLKAVDVSIIKIYENNVPQFYQYNDYKYDRDLRRVGTPVVQKTIRLDEDKALDLHKKNRFSLDLDKLIKKEPGAIYRVTIAFNQSYNVFNCTTDSAKNDNSSLFHGWLENIDDDDIFWSKYGGYYPDNYRWEDRDNPCTPSYYTSERFASRNLLASNIGLITKRGNDNSMIVVATDLLTAKPLADLNIELLDYQKQIIHTTKTDGDGMAKFDLKRKPFLLVAKNGSERGYLKLEDGYSLPLSRFDVGGDVVQNGLKGFIYGERGVWRPGDKIFLTFILEDKLKKLPEGYPVTMELYNPKGQLVKKMVNAKPLKGFYKFQTETESGAPTGNWLTKIRAGSATFSKTIKVETVMPNRLKINFDIGNATSLSSGSSSYATLSANWLFGAVGKNLKAKVDVNLNTMKTTFKGFENFEFDNPTVNFQSQVRTIFDGSLNENGVARVSTNLNENKAAPGMLKANFTTKVFEAGGNFSLDNFSIPYHVYNNYYGIKAPLGDRLSGMLLTDKDHIIDIVNVNQAGNLVNGTKEVEVELYKIQWRWWWQQDEENEMANFTQNSYNKLISKETIELKNGKANWKLRVNEPEWGRFLILVRDTKGGHVSGKSVYLDWPGWAQREQANNPTDAAMLSFTANKQKFNVGEDITLTIPSGKGGRALISIENGSRVIKTFWTDTKPGQTQFKFKAEKEMAPNVFANVTLLQPHAQTTNDLPVRMYGAIPLLIEDPQTILKPIIKMADKLKPEVESTIQVSEQNGKAMTYTIALVDEGLLDLTRFKTPNAHAAFYAREGLGVKTWDLFDYVLGAWGGSLERILSIGGDGSVNRNLSPAKANRFSPVVKYLGPFSLTKSGTAVHKFKLPQYIGSVRAMIVAGQDGAYGFAEKAVQVKKPLMVFATLPRVIGPGETFTLPATIFATEANLKNVSAQLQTKNLQVLDGNSRQVSFVKPGEQVIYFNVKAPEITGIASVKLVVKSGTEQTSYDVQLDIRNPNPYVTNVVSSVLQTGANWSQNYTPIGIPGTNTASIEVSSLPPINIKKRLSYLMQYPHGCVEQTTSAVFPQLYLGQLTALTASQKATTEKNIKSGINMLKGFQNTEGGLSYWPGQNTSDEWGTNYAAHFLIEAQSAGYTLPVGMFDQLMRYLKTTASGWVPNSNNFYGGDLSQAYRLYVLALARRTDMAAMNRLRAFEYLSV